MGSMRKVFEVLVFFPRGISLVILKDTKTRMNWYALISSC